jgi:hypothetical protein
MGTATIRRTLAHPRQPVAESEATRAVGHDHADGARPPNDHADGYADADRHRHTDSHSHRNADAIARADGTAHKHTNSAPHAHARDHADRHTPSDSEPHAAPVARADARSGQVKNTTAEDAEGAEIFRRGKRERKSYICLLSFRENGTWRLPPDEENKTSTFTPDPAFCLFSDVWEAHACFSGYTCISFMVPC